METKQCTLKTEDIFNTEIKRVYTMEAKWFLSWELAPFLP